MPTTSQSLYYTTPSGAGVFNAGTLRWGCALADLCDRPGRADRDFTRRVTDNFPRLRGRPGRTTIPGPGRRRGLRPAPAQHRLGELSGSAAMDSSSWLHARLPSRRSRRSRRGGWRAWCRSRRARTTTRTTPPRAPANVALSSRWARADDLTTETPDTSRTAWVRWRRPASSRTPSMTTLTTTSSPRRCSASPVTCPTSGQDLDLLTGAGFKGEPDEVAATQLVGEHLDVAPAGRRRVTARVDFVFDVTTSTTHEEALHGRLMLTTGNGGWKIFGYASNGRQRGWMMRPYVAVAGALRSELGSRCSSRLHPAPRSEPRPGRGGDCDRLPRR